MGGSSDPDQHSKVLFSCCSQNRSMTADYVKYSKQASKVSLLSETLQLLHRYRLAQSTFCRLKEKVNKASSEAQGLWLFLIVTLIVTQVKGIEVI